MLIPNITTEFKDSNNLTTVVINWDLLEVDGKRSVNEVHSINVIISCTTIDFRDAVVRNGSKSIQPICDRLLAWAAPQTIEQLKARLAF
jgi:hypothetical protein